MKTIKQLEKEIKEGSKMFGWTSTDGYFDAESRLQTLKDVLKLIDKEFEKQRKTTWDEDEEQSCNPIHQSDFIAWKKQLKQKIQGK